MNCNYFLVSVPDWALCALINHDFTGLSGEQIEAVKTWCDTIAPDGYICSEPDEHDQPNGRTIPAFGPLAPASVVWFTIFEANE